jgi:predicted dehydrogenase
MLDLSKDPDVDLVVCTVRVDKHLSTLGPSLQAGKDVFVEWPLGKSAAEARELLRLKNEGKVKNANVGLQGRQAPIIKKLKELVLGGRIGKVLNSTYVAQAGPGGPTLTKGVEYLVQKEFGGNLLTIFFGHEIDYFQQGDCPEI